MSKMEKAIFIRKFYIQVENFDLNWIFLIFGKEFFQYKITIKSYIFELI